MQENSLPSNLPLFSFISFFKPRNFGFQKSWQTEGFAMQNILRLSKNNQAEKQA